MGSLFVSACSCGGDGGDPVDASADAGGPLDLATATWELTPVGTRPGSIALRPDIAVTSAGEVVIAWPDIINIDNDTPILTASSADGFAEEMRSTSATGDRARPSISAAGERLHLVWNEDGGATNLDVIYTRRDPGSGWTAPVNITAAADANNLLQIDPTAVEADGVTTVFFNARPDSAFENAGLFAVSFTDPASPGPVQTLLDPAAFNCHEVEATTDGETRHVIAECEENDGPSALYYLNDRSGAFVRQTVDLGGAGSPLEPDITVGPDGAVHLVWVGSAACPTGTCRDVLYSRGLAPPVSVSNQSEDGGTSPVVAVDALGRVIVVYHRFGGGDLLWTYAESGSDFVRTLIATAGTDATDDFDAGGLEIDPLTGHPHTAFVQQSTGNADIVHAELK